MLTATAAAAATTTTTTNNTTTNDTTNNNNIQSQTFTLKLWKCRENARIVNGSTK